LSKLNLAMFIVILQQRFYRSSARARRSQAAMVPASEHPGVTVTPAPLDHATHSERTENQ
jgi:hypothetical protein